MEPIEIYSMPLEDRGNPYFNLWRKAMEAYAPRIRLHPVARSFLGFALAHAKPSRTHRILCIHWSTVLYGSRFALKSLILIAINFPMLAYLKYRGKFKVVWVVHNAYAHDYSHPPIDRLGRWLLSFCTDAFVAHQSSTGEKLAAEYPDKPCVCIPHGNYIGAYGPRLPIKMPSEDTILLLSLGTIRPYKRIEKIIESVRSIPNQSVHLLIAGKGEESYVARLKKMCGQDIRIEIRNQFVPENEIPTYFSSADYSMFYYDDSELTSGAIVLSLSYGVPVIARNIAGADVIDEGVNGYLFESEEGLRTILSSRLTKRDEGTTARTAHSIEGQSWNESARGCVALYKQLFQK